MGYLEQVATNIVRAGLDSMAPRTRKRGGGSGCLLLVAAMLGASMIVGVLVR